ncbi:utrophin [Pimephales promelas]|nr:utrophin [Pimephales promelas]
MASVSTLSEASEGGDNNQFTDIIKWRSDEHDAVQKKTFTKWINAQFSKVSADLLNFCFDGGSPQEPLKISHTSETLVSFLMVLSHLPYLVQLNRTRVRFPPWCGSFGPV